MDEGPSGRAASCVARGSGTWSICPSALLASEHVAKNSWFKSTFTVSPSVPFVGEEGPDDGMANVAGSRGPSRSEATDWLRAWPLASAFFSAATTGMLALRLVKIDKLLITLSLLPLLDRERGVGFLSFAKGLATREVGFGVSAVPSAGVAGSANENFSASGAALEREVNVVFGGIFVKLR